MVTSFKWGSINNGYIEVTASISWRGSQMTWQLNVLSTTSYTTVQVNTEAPPHSNARKIL